MAGAGKSDFENNFAMERLISLKEILEKVNYCSH